MSNLTRNEINWTNLWKYLAYGYLPIPMAIIPPKRPYYLWSNLEIIPYNSIKDYDGKLLYEIRVAIRRSLIGWEPVDRIGIWLSGGIDSSVLLYLTTEIVGSDNVRAYTLSFGERDEAESAKSIADWCDVKLIVKEMAPDDSISLTEEAVRAMRAPTDSTVVLYISKLCQSDGTKRVFSALGLDELVAGYPAHVRAREEDFFKVETNFFWNCQSNYVWAQLTQSREYIDVRFPYLDPELIAFCRGLPRSQKCRGQETKVRVRDELNSKSLIPKENIEAGRIVGTKGGFIPILNDWFNRGYGKWCDENIPPRAFNLVERSMLKYLLGRGRTLEGRLQRKLRAASLNAFYDLLDKGRFQLEEDG